jgi:hypothetical protein
VFNDNAVLLFFSPLLSTELKIAGCTTDFVNHVLDKVKSGVPGGGLDEL